MAEDGLQVPPAPDVYGPRRLVRYRREYLASLREQEARGGAVRSGGPASLAPAGDVASLQQRFAALTAMGSIGSLDWDEEFRRYIAGQGAVVPFRHEDLLDEVRSEIMGGSTSAAARPEVVVNPAHLSGLTNADLQSQAYDDAVLGPLTTGVDLVVPAAADAGTAEGGEDSLAAQGHPGADQGPQTVETNSAVQPPQAQGSGTPDEQDPAHGPVAAPEARPVRAVDAHGLDLSGLDQKAPGNGGRGRVVLLSILVLLLVAAVVLGLLLFL